MFQPLLTVEEVRLFPVGTLPLKGVEPHPQDLRNAVACQLLLELGRIRPLWSKQAQVHILLRRAHYGGRKGNSARRRLGFRPSTSAQALRDHVQVLRTLSAIENSVEMLAVQQGGDR